MTPAAIDVPPGRDPFAVTANPDAYVPTASIDRALTQTLTALGSGQVPVVVGPTGLGKTLLLQLTARRLTGRYTTVYIPFTAVEPRELAQLVLGLLESTGTGEGDPVQALLDEVRRLDAAHRPLLLLVDDAASLPEETAREVADWIERSDQALHVAMAGLPTPAMRAALTPFGEKAVLIRLTEGLRPEEIAGYVQARLAEAEAGRQLRARFDADALAELARISQGNPRQLHLAAQALARTPAAEELVAVSVPPSPPPDVTPSPTLTPAPSPTPAPTPTSTPAPATAPAPTPAATPASVSDRIGEYRFARGNVPAENAPPEVAKPTPAPAPREPQVDLTQAAASDSASPTPWSGPEDREHAHPSAMPEDEPPSAQALLSRRLRWLAVGVAGLAFLIGVVTQLSGPDESVPAPSATAETPGTPAPEAAPENVVRTPRPPELPVVVPGLVITVPEVAPEPEVAPAPEVAPSRVVATPAPRPPPVVAEPEPEPVSPAPEPEPILEPAVSVVVEPAPAPPAPEPVVTTPEPEVQPEVAVVAEPEPVPPTPEPIETTPEPAVAVVEPPPVAPPKPPAPVAPAPTRTPAPTRAPAPAGKVKVAINATPWATIVIDGYEVGETPLAGIELTVGMHRFRARMPDGTLRYREVTIDANNTTVVFE